MISSKLWFTIERANVVWSIVLTITYLTCLVLITSLPAAVASDRLNSDGPQDSAEFTRLPTPEDFHMLEDFQRRLNRFPLDHPAGYAEWRARSEAAGLFRLRPIRSTTSLESSTPGCQLAVIVNSLIVDTLKAALDLYLLDLAGEGFAATIYATSGGTPEDMRAFLQQLHAGGMDGCLLIGDMPVPWYEMSDCFSPGWNEEFPCDLFYMDLDGTFTDADADGLYDQHTGQTAPDIWFGRLTASSLTFESASEVSLLMNYFEKNHRYRSGLAPLAEQALVYTDDDWIYRSSFLEHMIVTALSQKTCVSDPWVTMGTDYEQRVSGPNQFVQVWVHSNWTRHNFIDPNSNVDCTYNWELPQLDPSAYFYNLCGCYNAFYTETDYIAGWYVFNPTYGLAAVSSTKAGEMMYFQDYFPSLGEQRPIGLAFLDWFQAQAANSFWTWEACFYYGMTLLGDPTLTLPQKSPFRQLRYDNEWGGPGVEQPNAYGIILPNNRFTVSRSGTLARILFLTSFSNAPTCRVYIWNSNGTFPSNLIDSVDVALETVNSSYWTAVDVSDRNITFLEGDNFHVGLSVLDPQPGQYMTLHSSLWTDTIPVRSSVQQYGVWKSYPSLVPGAHNFDLRAVVLEDPEPTVEIVTLTLPAANLGELYECSLDVDGGVAPYVWEVRAGELPYGLTLDPESGVISGVPLTDDTAHLTVLVTDQSPEPLTDFQHLTLAVQTCVDSDGDGVADVCCCVTNRGNADNDPDDKCDIGDLTALIAYLFIPPYELPACLIEANIDGEGLVDISDLTALIGYLFIPPFDPPASCP